MRYLTQADLDAGLAKWRAILHLQDWEIAVTLVPQTTWEDRGQSGDCSVQTESYSAEIRISEFETLDHVGYHGQQDMERTLVHELLHVVFRHRMLWADRPAKHQRKYFEHSIEQMARALVELDRRAA